MFHADRLRPRARQLSLMQERRSTCCSVPPTRCIFRDRARASREVQASQLGSPGGLLPGDDEPAQFSWFSTVPTAEFTLWTDEPGKGSV